MSDSGRIDIPIGADLAALQAAFSQIQGHVTRMGERINASLSSSNSSLNTTSSFAGKIQRSFTNAWQSISRGASAAFSGMVSAASAAASAIGSVMSGVMSIAKKLALPTLLGGLLGGVGLGAVAAQSAMLAGSFEQINIAITALIGSSKVAGDVMEVMKGKWRETGVTVAQQAGTIRKFLALGFDTKDAVKLGNNILDIAGAVGLAADQADLLGSALAQVKAKGIVSMEELRQQIAEKGVPVFEALAKSMNVSQGELIKLVSDGKVPAENLLKIFLNMEGSFAKFAGGAARLGSTFIGMLERIKGTTQLVFAAFAAPIIDSIKPFLDMAIARIHTMQAAATEMGEKIKTALNTGLAAFQTGNLVAFFSAGLELAMINGVNKLTAGIQGTIAFLSASLGGIMSAIGKGLQESGIEIMLTSLFSGIAELFSAKILKAAAGVAMSFGRVGQAKDLAQSAIADKARSDNYFQISKAAFESIDLSRGLAAMSGDFAEAMRIGQEAFQEAASSPWLDASIAEQKMSEVRSILKEQMEKNAAALKAAAETTTENLNPSEDENTTPATTSSKNLGTLTTSLGRVGGGGFGMTFFPMISEQKRTNTLLQSIAKNTIPRQQNSIYQIV